MKALEMMQRVDKRRLRAQALTAHIMHIVGKYVDRDRERDCMRDLTRELLDELYARGVEIITDEDRIAAGLPPRGPDGWTMEEIVALEKRRLELMYAPMPPIIMSAP